MIKNTLIFIKYLLFIVINCHIYFSHIKQFCNFYLRKYRRTLIFISVSLIQKLIIYLAEPTYLFKDLIDDTWLKKIL